MLCYKLHPKLYKGYRLVLETFPLTHLFPPLHLCPRLINPNDKSQYCNSNKTV